MFFHIQTEKCCLSHIQTEKVLFISSKPKSIVFLIYRPKSGQRLQYTDDEIIGDVIRAMSPGLRIRTIVETLANLKLPRLRLTLRSHFNEKAASKLFHEPSSCVQYDIEEVDEFLMLT